MYEWRNAKVDGSFRKAFEVANDIAWVFDDEKVRTAYVLFAALYDSETALSKQFTDMGYYMLVDLECFINDQKIFASVFGEKAAEKFFSKDETEKAKLFDKEALGLEDDEITDKVLNVLNGIFEGAEGESQLEILEPNYSDKLETLCDEALEICKASGKDYIDLDTLIYCIMAREGTSARKFMETILPQMEIRIEDFLTSLMITSNIIRPSDDDTRVISVPPALESCIEVLNSKYSKDDECTILGREKEIFKAFNIFSKKTKRNAVLVGHPGVGKTAIIEAVTQKIVNGTCPREFKNYIVLSLDVSAMVAGTKYRGEFETKVSVLKQFLEHTPNVILFVDEMHQMLGAGGTSDGSTDLSGSLKPILSRDDVVFVGATTIREYEQILSRDGAFKRRFEVIDVEEPKIADVKAMIKAKLKCMEKYHKVEMPDELVDYIILCSSCFNSENRNPDKTLDLCDRAMAISKMKDNTVVSRDEVDLVYEEYFRRYDGLSKKDIEKVAYHEIGHYVVTRLTKENEAVNVTAISIIPSDSFMGVNILEHKDSFFAADKEYADSYIMSLLAGRVSEAKISGTIDSGAASDLKAAKEYAKKVIAAFGLDNHDNFKHMYLLDKDLFNEKIANMIEERANDYIRTMYEKTEQFIEKHWDIVTNMANYLMEKKIVTSDELEQFVKE